MSKLHKQRIIDPEAALKKFHDDLAKLQVGAKSDAGPTPVRHRALDKDFRLDLSGFVFNQWAYILGEQHTLADALDPVFWADQVDKIMGHDKSRGRGDTINVWKPSTGESALLRIIEINVGFVRTVLMQSASPPQVEIAADSPLDTRWNVGSRTHEVIRKADRQILQGGFQTKAKAAEWIADHLAKMNRAA